MKLLAYTDASSAAFVYQLTMMVEELEKATLDEFDEIVLADALASGSVSDALTALATMARRIEENQNGDNEMPSL